MNSEQGEQAASSEAKVSDAVAASPIQVDDRVLRKGASGCYGIVKDVREEVTATTIDKGERALLVSVLWDNGTFSYFTPDALEKVK